MPIELRWKTLCVVASVLFIISCGGSGGTSDPGSTVADDNTAPDLTNNTTTPDVVSVISSTGGTLQHEDGVYIEVPEDAVDNPSQFSISKVDLPQILPSDISANAEIYEIEFEGIELKKPVKLTLPLSNSNLSSDPVYLGIYKWDGSRWYYTGGSVENGQISTYLTSFSVFVIGTGRSLHKTFEFFNSIGYNCSVYVDSYELAHPDLDAPLTGSWGVPVFLPPNNYPGAYGSYPQGSYRFCAEFWVDDGFPEDQGKHHVFIGSEDPNFSYSLDENSSDIVPPVVWFNTLDSIIPGPCPGIRNVGSDPGVNPDGTPITVSGTWRIFLRCSGFEEDAVVVDVVINENGGEFSGTGSGEDYDGTPITVNIQGGYYTYENRISGTATFTADNSSWERIDGFSVVLVNDTGYVPLTKESTTGGCDGEIRLLKIQ
jgi:hypothetical protein